MTTPATGNDLQGQSVIRAVLMAMDESGTLVPLNQKEGGLQSYAVPPDHGALPGLNDDDHLNYVHLANARTVSAVHTLSNGVTLGDAGAAPTVTGKVAMHGVIPKFHDGTAARRLATYTDVAPTTGQILISNGTVFTSTSVSGAVNGLSSAGVATLDLTSAANITGPLAVAKGGTGAAISASTGALPYFSSATVMGALSVGATSTVLKGATGAPPTWGQVVTAEITDANITLPKLETRARPAHNYLINGGFDVNQRGSTRTSVASDGYIADRWRCMWSVANVDYSAGVAGGSGQAEVTGRLSKTTALGKMGLCQIVEARESFALRSRTVIFQCRMKGNAAHVVKMAILQVGSGGGADIVASPMISVWGAGSADPTSYASGITLLASESKTLSSSQFDTHSITTTLPAGDHNVIVAVWSRDVLSVNDWIDFTEAGLYDGAELRNWFPSRARDIALCHRFYEKSFPLDTTPATAAGLASAMGGGALFGSQTAAASTAFTMGGNVRFREMKRGTVPTIVLYNPGASNSQVRNYTGAGSDCADSAAVSSNQGFYVNATSPGGSAIGQVCAVHWTADAEI